jgi:hypothetical protein
VPAECSAGRKRFVAVASRAHSLLPKPISLSTERRIARWATKKQVFVRQRRSAIRTFSVCCQSRSPGSSLPNQGRSPGARAWQAFTFRLRVSPTLNAGWSEEGPQALSQHPLQQIPAAPDFGTNEPARSTLVLSPNSMSPNSASPCSAPPNRKETCLCSHYPQHLTCAQPLT